MNLLAKLERIRQLVSAAHARVIARLLGREVLTTAERELLDSLPKEKLEVPERSLIEEAYRFGRLLFGGADQADTSPERFEAEPVPLTPVELASIEAAKQSAGQSIRALGARAEQDAALGLIDTARRVRAEVAGALEQRQTVAQLSAKLRAASADRERDWDRVAVTEIHSARQAGYADHVREMHGGEAEVFKRPMPDACGHCIRLHVGPDGHPRIFKLSELEANGQDNAGRSKAEWLAVVGSTHPHCSCELVHMPSGWGFDANGNILPGATGGRLEKAEIVPEPQPEQPPTPRPRFHFRDPRTLSKTLDPSIGGATSIMGHRAVDTGVSGLNVAWHAPVPEIPGDSNYREVIDEYVSGITMESALKRDRETYRINDLENVPIHPVDELEPVLEELGEPDMNHAADVRAWLQGRLDRRVAAGNDATTLRPRTEDPYEPVPLPDV